MREISMQSIFGGLPEIDVEPSELSCHRMIVGRLFFGYGINPAQRDFIRWWLHADPEAVDERVSIAYVFEYGMGHYTPDFTEPSYFSNDFDPITWRDCRDYWVKERILARTRGAARLPHRPLRYDAWLDVWGTWYEQRATAQRKRKGER